MYAMAISAIQQRKGGGPRKHQIESFRFFLLRAKHLISAVSRSLHGGVLPAPARWLCAVACAVDQMLVACVRAQLHFGSSMSCCLLVGVHCCRLLVCFRRQHHWARAVRGNEEPSVHRTRVSNSLSILSALCVVFVVVVDWSRGSVFVVLPPPHRAVGFRLRVCALYPLFSFVCDVFCSGELRWDKRGLISPK